jgi:co-chaperonin GroES (HSP10)
MKIKPLFDRVLAEPVTEQMSAGGIYIPTAQTERSQIMTVVAVGDITAVSTGDKIIINKYCGAEVSVGERKQYIVKEIDILGVIYE